MIRIKLFMEGKEMDLQTLILVMSIPSAVTGFCFWLIEEKIKKQQKETEEKEKIREKSEVLIIKKRDGINLTGGSNRHGPKERARKRGNGSRLAVCQGNKA